MRDTEERKGAGTKREANSDTRHSEVKRNKMKPR